MPQSETSYRGILNESEEKYLRGESDIEPKSQRERVVRSRIREHIIQAIRDFNLIEEKLEDRDRKRIFEEYKEWEEGFDDEFNRGLNQMLLFIQRGLRENGVETEKVFESGIRAGEFKYQRDYGSRSIKRANVDIDIEVENFAKPAEVLEKLRKGEPVTAEEVDSMRCCPLDSIDENVIVQKEGSTLGGMMSKEDLKDLVVGKLEKRSVQTEDIEVRVE